MADEMDQAPQATAPTGVFTEQSAPEPAPVLSPTELPPLPKNSDEQVHTTSLLAALAYQRNNPAAQNKTLYDSVRDAKGQIEAGQEDQLRADTAGDKRLTELQALHEEQRNLLTSPGYGAPSDLHDSFNRELDLTSQPLDPHSIEKEGVAEIQERASQDPHQALVQHDLITKTPNVVLSIQDNITFMAAWNNAVDGLRQEVAQEGWVNRALNMFALMPFQTAWATANAIPSAKAAILPGEILGNAVSALNHMPLQERLAAIPQIIQNIRLHSGLFGENLDLSLSVLQGMMGGNFIDRMGANVWAAQDALTVVGAAKFVTKPFQLATALGNRSAAVNTVAGDALREFNGVGEQVGGVGIINGRSWVEAMIPSKWKTANMVGPGPGVSGSVFKQLQQTEDAVQNFLATSAKNQRVNAQQAQELIRQQADRLALELDGENVLDVSTEGSSTLTRWGDNPTHPVAHVTQDPETGLYKLSAYVGDHLGMGGYRNLKLAQEGIEARGWDPKDVGLVELPDQSYALKFTQTVREDQPFTPNMTTTQRAWGRTAMFFKEANDMRDITFQGPALRALGIQAGMTDRALRPLITRIASISPKSRSDLQKVVDMGNAEKVVGQSQPGRWYNMAEFQQNFERVSGHPPSQKETLAYYSFKQMRDMDYYLRNREIRIGLDRRGIKTVSVTNEAKDINIPRQNGRELTPDQHDLHSDRFLDADEGKIYPAGKGGAKLEASVKEKLASGNYRIIELQEPYGPANNPVKHILAHKQTSSVGPLARHQLDYVGGSPVEYRGGFFTKQARSVEVDGEKRWLSPLTHANHMDQAQGAAYAGRQEAARQAYNKIEAAKSGMAQFPNLRTKAARAAKQTLDDLVANSDEVFKASEAHTLEKFSQFVKEGKVSAEYPFEVVGDNTQPPAMNAGNARRWFDIDEGSIEGLNKTKGRMYYSERGERLSDGNGKLAPVVDPWKASIGSLEQMIKSYSFGDYHNMVTENWVRLARQSGLIREEEMTNHSIQHVFLNAKFDEAASKATIETQQIAARLDNDRELHMRLLGLRTQQQVTDNMNARKLAALIDGHGTLSDWAAAQTMNLKDKNPLQAIRAAVYDTGIAMWNVGRFVVHGFMSAMAIAVHPQYGGQAAVMYPLIRLLGINRDSKLLDFVANHFATDHGFTPENFKNMMNAFHSESRFYMGDAMEVAESMAGRIGSTTVGQQFSNFRRGGRVFFNEADRMNHIISWQIAYRDALDQPGLKEGTQEFMDYVLRKENVLTGSMSRAGSAAWQKGVFGLPGQFHTLQARLLERMLPKQFGGNQMLTGAQRMRFYGGGLLMLGAASVPGLPELADWAGEQYQHATGQPISEGVWKSISDGLIDGALFGMSDGKINTEWGGRVGLGSFVDDIARNINSNLLTNLGGATEQYAGRMGGNILEIVNVLAASRAEQDGFNSQDFDLVAEDMLKVLPAFNNAERAYYIYRYGLIRDPRTGDTITHVDKLNAFAAELGVPIHNEVEFWKDSLNQSQRDQYVTKQAQMALKFQHAAFDAMLRGDHEEALHDSKVVAGLMKAYDGDPMMRKQIVDQMYKLDRKGPDEYQSLLDKMYLRNGELPLGQGQK